MARQTTYTCDYSSQVKPHPAIFTIDAGHEATGLNGVDACERHVGKMVAVLLSKGITKSLHIHINGDVVASNGKLVQAKDREGSGYICSECGYTGSSSQGLAMHRYRAHNITKEKS